MRLIIRENKDKTVSTYRLVVLAERPEEKDPNSTSHKLITMAKKMSLEAYDCRIEGAYITRDAKSGIVKLHNEGDEVGFELAAFLRSASLAPDNLALSEVVWIWHFPLILALISTCNVFDVTSDSVSEPICKLTLIASIFPLMVPLETTDCAVTFPSTDPSFSTLRLLAFTVPFT